MAEEGPGRDGHIAHLLREARDQAGISQRDLASRVDVSRSTIIKAEDGESLPTLDALAKLAIPLDLSMQLVVVSYTRDALRKNARALASFDREQVENHAYGKARADLLGLEVEEATFTATVAPDGSVTLDQRWQNSRATRELRSLSFWLLLPSSPERVSSSFTVEEAPVLMRWRQETTVHGNERLNRVHFDEPWKPSGPHLTFVNRMHIPCGYQTDRDRYEATKSPLTPVEKWPGKFCIHIEHLPRRISIVVRLPKDVIWGPPYSHWESARSTSPMTIRFKRVECVELSNCKLRPVSLG